MKEKKILIVNTVEFIMGGISSVITNYYKEINTNGLTIEEIELQLSIERTKIIKAIKNMIIFFVVLTVISLICLFFFGSSISNTLNDL